MKFVCVIPARFASSRLPGKPLKMIDGRTMIERVYQKAKSVQQISQVIVATEDVRIMNYCKSKDINSILTSIEHKNGSERVSEVSREIESDYIITLQGDEPLIEIENIQKSIDFVAKNKDIEILSLMKKFTLPVDIVNNTTPKVVLDSNSNALYISRSPIPFPMDNLDFEYYKPLGIYLFKKFLIDQYLDMKVGYLEKTEQLELLRFIENGYKIRFLETESSSIAVDTYKDLLRVERIFEEKND